MRGALSSEDDGVLAACAWWSFAAGLSAVLRRHDQLADAKNATRKRIGQRRQSIDAMSFEVGPPGDSAGHVCIFVFVRGTPPPRTA
jgi:hypothetical protein